LNNYQKPVPVLSVRNLTRQYVTGGGTLDVLIGANIDIYAGEIVGLIGPSGSGKSSLLHAAGLLETPTGGKVYVKGKECLSLSDRERTRIRREEIGFVYQFHHLLREFSAIDNVVLPQQAAGVPYDDARREAARLLNLMGLSDRTEHQPGQMSGGEQQRVAIARAIANKPSVIMADEPTGNLDPATSGNVFQSLFDLSRTEGVAALVATHNMELMPYMDRVVTVRDGQIVPYS